MVGLGIIPPLRFGTPMIRALRMFPTASVASDNSLREVVRAAITAIC